MPVKLYTDININDADFYDLADQIYYIKNHKCMENNGNRNSRMKDYKGDIINLVNHIIVATDSGIDYFDKEDEANFYLDATAAKPLKWKILAKYLLTHDFNNDGIIDFTGQDIIKIFSTNAITAYARALNGNLPFDRKFCALTGNKKFIIGNFLIDNKPDLAITGDNFIAISKNSLEGHFDGVKRLISSNNFCQNISQQLLAGDFDGDGLDDFLCYDRSNNKLNIIQNSNNTFIHSNYTKNLCGSNSMGKLHVYNHDGDQKDEIICHNKSGEIVLTKLFFSNSSFFNSRKIHRNFCLSPQSKFLVGDINGDGRDDLYCHTELGQYTTKVSNTRFASEEPPTLNMFKLWCDLTNSNIYLGDFDGDGLDDRLCINEQDNKISIDYKKMDTQVLTTLNLLLHSVQKLMREFISQI